MRGEYPVRIHTIIVSRTGYWTIDTDPSLKCTQMMLENIQCNHFEHCWKYMKVVNCIRKDMMVLLFTLCTPIAHTKGTQYLITHPILSTSRFRISTFIVISVIILNLNKQHKSSHKLSIHTSYTDTTITRLLSTTIRNGL